MGFAIGFVVLGLCMAVLGAALMATFGLATKVTFSFMWFVVTGILIAIITLAKYIINPTLLFKKKGVQV